MRAQDWKVRQSRPGKMVQLLEGEIQWLCNEAKNIFDQQPKLLELEVRFFLWRMGNVWNRPGTPDLWNTARSRTFCTTRYPISSSYFQESSKERRLLLKLQQLPLKSLLNLWRKLHHIALLKFQVLTNHYFFNNTILNFWLWWRDANEWQSDRSRQALEYEYYIANIGVDTADIEPPKVSWEKIGPKQLWAWSSFFMTAWGLLQFCLLWKRKEVFCT